MRNLINLLMFILIMFPTMVFAQEAAPSGVEAWLAGAGDWLVGNLGAGTSLGLGASVVLELVFRVIKTDKPLSLIRGGVRLARLVADLLEDLANVADQVLPQKTKK